MAISVPAELSAAATLVQYWNNNVNPAVWITIFLVVIVILNFCGVRLYGEVGYPALNSKAIFDVFCSLKSSLHQ